MCLLSYCNHDATPDYSGLEIACINNPDGFGWAVHQGDNIVVGRAMDAAVALDTYRHAVEQNPGCASMFHARFTTHGTTDLSNCHPFWVGSSRDTLLAHNGIISQAPREKDRSDTRWFAEVELPRRGLQILDKPTKYAKLERYLGSKVIIFTTREDLKYGIYILNENMGSWDKDGRWWSNDTHEYIYQYSYYFGNSAAVDEVTTDVPDLCESCGTWLSEEESEVFGYCLTCEMCLDCKEMFGDCLCYQGRAASRMYEEEGWSAWDADVKAIASKSLTLF